jgi:hypothetical protein
MEVGNEYLNLVAEFWIDTFDAFMKETLRANTYPQ